MPAHPDEAIWLIRQLRHTKGKHTGKPFRLQDFQEDFLRQLLRLDRRGRRIVTRALLGIARKNGKSELGAALALVFLILDREPGGEVISAAGKRDQARIILETAKRMVRYSKIGGRPLSDFLVVRRDHIEFPEMDSRYKVISADAEKEHGANPHAVIFDELHVQGERRGLWDALITAQGARDQPILVSLSTAGPARKGLCYDEYRHGLSRNDPEYLCRWWEADGDLDLDDPQAWKQANPGLDSIVSRDFLASAAKQVIDGRAPEYTFRRLHLNQWTNALERWLPRNRWEACSGPPDIPDGARVWIGMDAALKRDSYGIAVVHLSREWVEDQNGLSQPQDVAHVLVRAFTPAEEGEYIDQIDVENFVLGMARRYTVENVVYDPAYMQLMAQRLGEHGVPIEAYPQSPEKMGLATENFQRMVLEGRMRHGDDRTLSEQLAAVAVRETDRSVRISKGKSGDRIDAVVALVMALQAAIGDPTDDQGQDFAVIP